MYNSFVLSACFFEPRINNLQETNLNMALSICKVLYSSNQCLVRKTVSDSDQTKTVFLFDVIDQ